MEFKAWAGLQGGKEEKPQARRGPGGFFPIVANTDHKLPVYQAPPAVNVT